MKKNNELEATLKTIAEQAKSLRDAGVTGNVTVDGISFTLAPRDYPETTALPSDDDDEDDMPQEKPRKVRSALDDPNTYARRKVPSRQHVGDDRD